MVEQLLLAAGEAAGDVVGLVEHLEAAEDRGGPRRRLPLRRSDHARPEEQVEQPLARLVPRADHHVVEHRQPLGEPRHLEGPADAATGRRLDAAGRQPLAVEPHLAGIRRIEPGHDVEKRRLARAVRPDQADDLARARFEADADGAPGSRRRRD